MSLKKHGISWPDVALIVVILLYFSWQSDLISGFKQLPSPLYGGDYYYQMGAVNNVKYGGSALGGSNLNEGGPGYFVLYAYIVGNLARMFGLDAMSAMFYFSEVVLVLSLLISYLFVYCLFRRKEVALIGALLYVQITRFPVIKYTDFAQILVFPVFLYALLYFFRERTIRSAALLGAAFGIFSLSHGVALLVAGSAGMMVFAYLFFIQHLKKGEHGMMLDYASIRKDLYRNATLAAVVFGVGLSIAMLYWYGPVFKNHLKVENTLHMSSGTDFWNPAVQANFVGGTLRGLFFSDWVSALRLLGIALFLLVKKYTDGMKFAVLMFGTFLLLLYHFLLTIPLLNTHFLPNHMLFFGALPFLLPALFSLCVLADMGRIKRYSAFMFLLLTAYIVYSQSSAWDAKIKEDRWVQVGFAEQQPNMQSLRDWVASNTGVNDVFLSSNELSFALNALTGRKVVTTRKAQNYPFIDIDARAADAAVILYGNNTRLRVDLLKKYKVTYLYWDYYWIQSEYSFDNNGRMVGTFDPLMVFEKPYYHAYFNGSNVSYFKMYTWPDPAGRDESVRKYDLLFVVPNQWNWQHPWSNQLDPYLREVWNYTQDGQVISRVYEIKA